MPPNRGIDADLVLLDGGSYDLQIGDDGDVKTADFFDTAVTVSLFAEKRANESEVAASHYRRGWIGNEYTPGFEIGSKLWVLMEQSKLTRTTMNQIRDEVRNALQWLVDDGHAVRILGVDVQLLPPASPIEGIWVEVTIERTQSVVETRFFDLWEQTGVYVPPSEPGPPVPLTGATPLGVTTSVAFDGSTEYFEDSVDSSVGLANQWSISVWVKPTGASRSETIFDVVSAVTTNRIRFFKNAGTSDFEIEVGNAKKNWRLSESGYIGAWSHHTFTFDGSLAASEQLKWYVDGVDRSGDATRDLDVTLTMVDESRSITIGRRHAPASEYFLGRVHSLAMFDAALTASAISDVHSEPDADLREDFGAFYASSSDLLRYYVHGLDPTSGATMGEDYGNATDRDLTPTNVDPTDLVSDVPS